MERFLPVVNRKNCCKVWLKDVVYVENEGRKLKIVTEDKNFFLYAKISDFNIYFEGDKRFYRCMKGMIVNFEKVDSMKDQIIYFGNGMQYMLGRTNYLKAKQTFVNYMRTKKYELKS